MSFEGEWGYHPLVVSRENTNKPNIVEDRSGNQPSHEGVGAYFDAAIALCRRAGFTRFLLRGDTDFSRTEAFDHWDDVGVQFVFGHDAMPNLRAKAGGPLEYAELERHAERVLKTVPRARAANVKEQIVGTSF